MSKIRIHVFEINTFVFPCWLEFDFYDESNVTHTHTHIQWRTKHSFIYWPWRLVKSDSFWLTWTNIQLSSSSSLPENANHFVSLYNCRCLRFYPIRSHWELRIFLNCLSLSPFLVFHYCYQVFSLHFLLKYIYSTCFELVCSDIQINLCDDEKSDK